MKSKAHFKKCSELGISPIPTMPDDDVNDFDDSASEMQRRNARENDSRGDSETEDNDSDDDMDDESGDGEAKKC